MFLNISKIFSYILEISVIIHICLPCVVIADLESSNFKYPIKISEAKISIECIAKYMMAGFLKYVVYVAFFLCILASLVELVDNNESKSNTKIKKLQIGIKKRIEGCEVKSKKGDVLHMHYKGILEDGTEFDNSYKRGEPLSFTLGSGQVIRGWDQGLLKMCEGEKRKLVIPPDLGYGSAGAPPTIPGDAVLFFEVELVKIERKSEL